ncbi:MAG: hypothetical protein Q9170_003394 [Blastenia crenularia]
MQQSLHGQEMEQEHIRVLSLLEHKATSQIAFCVLDRTPQTCARSFGSEISPAVWLAQIPYLDIRESFTQHVPRCLTAQAG